MTESKLTRELEQLKISQEEIINVRDRILSEIEARQKQVERCNHDVEFQSSRINFIEGVIDEYAEKEVYLDKALDQLERFLNENRANDVYAIGLIENAEANIRKYFN